MSVDRHRFRHLTDHNYQRLFAELAPLPCCSAPPFAALVESESSTVTVFRVESESSTVTVFRQARYYDPCNGRWLSQDPLAFEAGTADLYPYAPGEGGDCAPEVCGLAAEDCFEWTGRVYEVEDGLQYNRTRCCDPIPGVWLDHDGRVVPAHPLPGDRPQAGGCARRPGAAQRTPVQLPNYR